MSPAQRPRDDGDGDDAPVRRDDARRDDEALPGEERFAATLQAYRRAKWAQLSDEGEESLLQELGRLETALADPDWGGGRVLHVDNDFRRAKVRVLKEVLRAAEGQD